MWIKGVLDLISEVEDRPNKFDFGRVETDEVGGHPFRIRLTTSGS